MCIQLYYMSTKKSFTGSNVWEKLNSLVQKKTMKHIIHIVIHYVHNIYKNRVPLQYLDFIPSHVSSTSSFIGLFSSIIPFDDRSSWLSAFVSMPYRSIRESSENCLPINVEMPLRMTYVPKLKKKITYPTSKFLLLFVSSLVNFDSAKFTKNKWIA